VPGDEQANDHDGLIMSTTEETHQCEIELELSKHDFQEDVSQIGRKMHETRVRFSLTHVLGEKPLLISALGLLVGFVLGCWDLGNIGKPMARTMLTGVGNK
jgi:hypothetical protein